MATASECYAALCNIRSIIVEQLKLLGYPVDTNDCLHMCITDLVSLYANYTGRTYTVENLDAFMDNTVPSAEWLNKVIECDGQFATCIAVGNSEYDWARLDEESTLIEHTIKADGTYNASDFAADGFSKIVVDTSEQRNLQNKTVTPSSELQVITADETFIGLGTVTVKGVKADSAHVIATKEPQIILPVSDGSFFKQVNVEPIQNQVKTVTPTTSDKNITPDQGYDGLDRVVVKGDAKLLPENIVTGVTIFGTVGTAGTNTNGKPIEISTEADMNLRRSAASADTAGTLYKYTGDTGVYTKNKLYVVTTSEPYALMEVSYMYLTLDDTMITLNGNVVTWTPVPFATEYYVLNGGATLDIVKGTTYTLDIDEPGVYDIRVLASAPGYEHGESNTLVYYVGQTKVVKSTTYSFPVGNSKSIATTFNNKAIFMCSTADASISNIIEYDTDGVYRIYDAPALFHAVASTPDYMFAVDDTNIYAYDSDGAYTIIADVFEENNGKSGVALGNYAIFDTCFNTYAVIDDTLTLSEVWHSRNDNGHWEVYGRRENTCACCVGNYAIFGGGRLDYSKGEVWYEDEILDTETFTDRITEYTAINKDLVSTGVTSSTSTLSAGAAAASVGGYAIFAGGRINTYDASYGYHMFDVNEGGILICLGYSFKKASYSRAVEAIDKDLACTSLVLPRYVNNLCATAIGNYAIFGGGEKLSDSKYFDNVDVVSADLVVGTSDALSTGRSYISATTLVDKAIIAGGGSAVSSNADVYTVQIVYE